MKIFNKTEIGIVRERERERARERARERERLKTLAEIFQYKSSFKLQKVYKLTFTLDSLKLSSNFWSNVMISF